ncbi:hypothetical protein HDU67_003721, partial [Dinochytrium kinnereticum]
YRVVVFANGDTANPGLKLVLNYRNCKSFDQLLTILSNLMRLKAGFVRKLYDAESGRRVQSLKDLKDGENLVAGTWEPFKRVKYPLINPNMNQFDVKKEDDTPRPVTFYPNGDSYHHGFTITLRKSRFHSLKKLIDHLNSNLDLPSGRITRIYTMEGKRIESIEDLVTIAASVSSTTTTTFPSEESPTVEDDGEASPTTHKADPHAQSHVALRSFVIGCGEDPFYHVPYDLNRVRSRHGPVGLGGTTTKNEFLGKIRGVAHPQRKQRKGEGEEGGLTRLDGEEVVVEDKRASGKHHAAPSHHPAHPHKTTQHKPQASIKKKHTEDEIEEDDVVRTARADNADEDYGAENVKEFKKHAAYEDEDEIEIAEEDQDPYEEERPAPKPTLSKSIGKKEQSFLAVDEVKHGKSTRVSRAS